MIKTLLATALYAFCPIFGGTEIGDKIYSYSLMSSEVSATLETKENSYTCIFDKPQTMGIGTRTIERYKCGPLVVFTQMIVSRCTYDDYNPRPDDFYLGESTGRRLLRIQHDCIKDGYFVRGFWSKIRDKNNQEWDLDESYVESSESSDCSTTEKISTSVKAYTIRETGQKIKITVIKTHPVNEVKQKPIPAI